MTAYVMVWPRARAGDRTAMCRGRPYGRRFHNCPAARVAGVHGHVRLGNHMRSVA
jgi:hypothetical protein